MSSNSDGAPRLGRLPMLAIVGRPNVGKSTLFNRLVGGRRAIVDDSPGVTRDRNYGEVQWGGRQFLVVDTGGLDDAPRGNLDARVQDQSKQALFEADAVLFLFDGKEGLNPADRDTVNLLRRVDKPVFFAVNKLDSSRRAENLYEFYALGIDRLYSISAEHGLGIGELLDQIVEQLPEGAHSETGSVGDEPQEPLRVAIVGRPNVGKSTLVNRLLGFERSVVDGAPGTTRDALDTPYVLGQEPCILVDTAGIRRKARIDDRIEQFSVHRSLRTVDAVDLVIHVVDGVEEVTDQDAQILSYACQRNKAVVLAINKWDLLAAAGTDADAYRDEVYHRLPFLDHAPLSFIAAATGHGVRKLRDTAAMVLQAYRRKISTSQLNQALQRIVKAHHPPLWQGRPVKFYYATQTGTRPPTFTLFVNQPRGVAESYRRYMTHNLREQLELHHAPIRLFLRPRREEGKGQG